MFYSEAILSRRGPLAKVWLAAHMERKLSKTQTLQTDIEQSVDAIMGQEVEVMALRLSGQLLLGVVRIYSRKAKYLLDDCNEALLKIKMAFRPGIVDMTEDQLAVNRNAITLQGNQLDLDALIPDINWDMDFDDQIVQPGGQHIAKVADITLANAEDYQFDFDDPGYGFDLGPSDGIGSQDYEPLGIDFGEGTGDVEERRSEAEDDSMSVGVGRDAAQSVGGRESLDAQFFGRPGADIDLASVRSREASARPFDDIDLDFGGDIDLGISFDPMPLPAPEPMQIDDQALTPQTPRLTPSRASSPLTEPPQTPPPGVELTPRVEVPEAGKAPRKKKEKKQIIDAVTELAEGPGARVGRGRGAAVGSQQVDVSGIVTEHHYLPGSSVVMRLLEIREDPVAHFLPTRTTAAGTFFCAAPPGLTPELAEMFMRPVESLSAPKRRGEQAERPPSKRARVEGTPAAEEEVEQARRASVAPSVALGSDVLGRPSVAPGDLEFDNTGGIEDFQLPEFQMDTGAEMLPEVGRERSAVPSELSRLSTPPPDAPVEEGEESYADVTCPIAIFDDRTSQQSQSDSQAGASDDGNGYSKNTVKALTVIRKELQPIPGQEQEKAMSFRQMSQKASRRAASSFFFELLVLGTRDCVKLSQAAPFENIEVRAKDKLWERQRHGSVAPSMVSGLRQSSAAPSMAASPRRQASVAPSIASAFGL
ncbi:Rec8 like protein-domain-containing protein [Fomitopsis serialis]|uniref:Rec8 like protein-domain-containing protein n=1 Tax=Fomitopsis serialis TaxID=139415 RepID=UPI0020076602|nr:Rec8 like protein-domain-containing protein [Neoantrodia serialis]KAH9935672.1 Rec8 like protein-domain-containing protein [Neoantrodia serialis]